MRRDGGWADNYRFSWRFFPRSMARSPQPIWLPDAATSGDEVKRGRRYVVFGESAAMGDPEPAFGFSRMLQALLEKRFQDEKVEVVNTAMTAINSHVLRSIAEDMAGVPATGWVVYAGNNEVMGPFGPGTVFGWRAPPRWWVLAQLAAREAKVGQWIQGLAEGRASAEGARTWRGMEMFLNARVPADSPALERVVRSFEDNLGDMIETARRRGIPMIVGAAAVNLKDSPPFAGAPPSDMAAPADRPAALRDGIETLTTAELRARWAERPAEAEAAWRLARALMAEPGDAAEAASLFRQACALDALRFRCDPALQAGVERLVTREAPRGGVTLVKPQAHLDSLSAAGVADAVFFYEHVHLTPRGSYELARLYASALTGESDGSWATLEECLQRLGHTPWHQWQTGLELQARLRRPPFSRQWGALERDTALTDRLRELAASLTPDRLREWTAANRALCSRHPGDWVLRRQTAALAEAAGEKALAVDLLTEAASLMPHHTSDQLLGTALNRAGRPAEAVVRLRAAVAERPNYAQAWNSLGIALARTGAPEEAEDAFGRAVASVPDYTEAYRNWAMVCTQRGAADRALAKLRLAHAAEPGEVAVRNDLGRALVAAGLFSEAWPHYETVAAALPGDANAQLNAALLLQKLDRRSEAAAYFERTLALDPANPHARQALGR
jgi:Flp pilus assembly protein TadD